jgi:hypothetical protein
VDVVRGGELDYHAGDDIGEEDGAFGNIRADQVQGGCKKDDIEDVIDQAWSILESVIVVVGSADSNSKTPSLPGVRRDLEKSDSSLELE